MAPTGHPLWNGQIASIRSHGLIAALNSDWAMLTSMSPCTAASMGIRKFFVSSPEYRVDDKSAVTRSSVESRRRLRDRSLIHQVGHAGGILSDAPTAIVRRTRDPFLASVTRSPNLSVDVAVHSFTLIIMAQSESKAAS